MVVFLGEFEGRVDEKGRIIPPAPWRRLLEGGAVVTTGQEGCLYVFPAAEFERITHLMSTAPGSTHEVREFVRVFRATAYTLSNDGQGRALLPYPLRRYASLTSSSDATFIGNGNRFEIWRHHSWREYRTETALELAAVPSTVSLVLTNENGQEFAVSALAVEASEIVASMSLLAAARAEPA